MPSFNNNPSNYVDLNNYFPVLNDKVGLSSEQFKLLVENTNYLLNHLGLADVEVGTITTQYGSPGTLANVVVTHRDVTDPDTGHTTDYFDYVFTIPTPSISGSASATLSDDPDDVAATVTPTAITSGGVVVGYTFDFAFTIPRGEKGETGICIRNRGAYSSSATYVNNDTYLDVVTYQGSAYCPKVASVTGELPTNTTYFDLLVSRGERGNGITNISKTSTSGLVDTYTIETDDGDDYTFNVTNGATPDVSGKADKVTSATNGNFAGLDSNGNLTDSGKKTSDFMASSEKVGKNLSINGNSLSLKDQDGNTLGSAVTIPQTDISGKQDKCIISKNVSVSSWSADSTYSGYSYKAQITINGVTSSDYAEVVFDVANAISGNYAPVCTTGTNTVTIYSKVSTSITIPSIVVTKGGS